MQRDRPFPMGKMTEEWLLSPVAVESIETEVVLDIEAEVTRRVRDDLDLLLDKKKRGAMNAIVLTIILAVTKSMSMELK